MKAPAWFDQFAAAGYRPYQDSLKLGSEMDRPHDQRMYVGSMQKRVTDERGIRYSLNVDLYDFTMHSGGRRSASAHVQFNMTDRCWDGCANVQRTVPGDVAETEAWFADLWSRMGWGYYEVEHPSSTASTADPDRDGRERT